MTGRDEHGVLGSFGRLFLLLIATICWGAGPVLAQPVSGEDPYVFGTGDIVRVMVFQNPDLTVETRVDAQGRITYPFAGAIDVKGRTPAQVEKTLADLLEQRGILKQPQVSVAITQLRSRQVSVLGLVARPGRFPLDVNYQLSDMLALAGGVLPNGSDTVVVSRVVDGKTKNIEVDLPRMFSNPADRSADLRMQPGDVVYVQRAPMFYIYGEVQRPGNYRLERGMTMQQALSAAGGLTLRGTQRGVRVTRKTEGGEAETLRVELHSAVQPDDVIQVQESLF